MKFLIYSFYLLLLMSFALLSCQNKKAKSNELTEQQEKMLLKMAQSYFTPLPQFDISKENEHQKKLIFLGKKLFYDSTLSELQKVSCASCHEISTYGTKNEAITAGNNNQKGNRNAPTVLNAYLQYAQNWDSKYKTVEDQALGMILNKYEMGIKDTSVLISRLKKEYSIDFGDSFPDSDPSVSIKNLKVAIGAFLRTLKTHSRFDDYLNGNTEALITEEKLGLKTFVENGCVPCHSTALVGGGMAQKFSLFGFYWDFTDSKYRDKGRYELTNKDEDMYIFKVPQLRNIEFTAPYMHDGSVKTLEEAIKIMAMSETNKQLDDKEVNNIATFLKSLSGKIPEHALNK